MKKGFFILLAGVAVALTGCVGTVTEQKAGGVPVFRDRMEGRYERPINLVFDASKKSLMAFGSVTSEGSLHTSSNQVRTLQGYVNQSAVYMRVEAVTPTVTSVIVQVRSRWGGTDLQIAHDLEKRVALELSN